MAASRRLAVAEILERSMDERWLANAYLVGDQPGGDGVLIDLNENVEPLLEAAAREGLTITHIAVTHETTITLSTLSACGAS
jgi:glyoxylase-like metal-dependent hydrolase (beta-lactamase superfamily II)